jgi:putative transposase
MTKVLVEGCGWVDSVGVLAGSTKTSVGVSAGIRGTAQHGLVALAMAVNRQLPRGARGAGLSWRSDHGGQPTSTTCMRAWASLGIQQALTSANHPKGHADPERVIRPRKEACLWRHAWPCPFVLASAREPWIDEYHAHDLHAALGDQPPRPFEREDHRSHGTQWPAA